MKIHYKAILLGLAGAAIAPDASASIDLDYYSRLQGLKGAALKTAVHEILTENVKMLDYGSGDRHTWWGFYVTDRCDDGMVRDRYSNDKRYFGSRGSSVSGMNIEHSFPKSWWGGSTNNAYKDLFNLMPCEQKINSTKSNYAMAVVIRPTDSGDNGCTRVGKGSDGVNYWEPADKWKGDFARGYMYMATAYQNFSWTTESGLSILQQGAYPTLKSWAAELYIEWAKQDPVDRIETDRNDDVESLQRNRNPFVDFPNLMEYIWGDSVSTPFNVKTTVKSAAYTGGGSIGDGPATGIIEELYASTFIGSDGGCEVETAVQPSGKQNVWTLDATYGWKASAAVGSNDNIVYYESDATLLTPEIDLAGYTEPSIKFDHAVKFAADPSAVLSVIVRADGEGDYTIPAQKIIWPKGTSWTFTRDVKVPLNDFAGKKVRIGFRYTSTTSEACTWEVQNFSLSARKSASGIEDLIDTNLANEADDSNAPAEYYSLDGRRVDPATTRGIVILRRGTRATKVILR
ncbi:MAG: endonuclease [[Clostridium] fimetarium]|nr:endonuclease [Alistipes timonensis]MCM1405454.1 endonuclease [[Clostridium] fimetarium]